MDRRVRTGCATCRRRRVKCDEQKPTCNRCRTANFHCEGYPLPRRLSNTSNISASRSQKSSSPESTASFPEISLRHKDWRQEQLQLYHHFVTTTAVRLFRNDHISFWRDEVAQKSYGVDLVYEALLALGAMHRSSLIACQEGNGPEAIRFKLLGFHAYGRTIKLLPNYLGQNSAPEICTSLIVLMLLAYFECFMENPKGAFRHLWAAIQILRGSENRLTDREVSSMVPIFDAMLRLDFLAQKHVPYARSSFLRCSDLAIMESPFWNRLSPEFSGSTHADLIAAERYRLIQLVCAHNKLSRVVWGDWCPADERPSRDELMGFYSEMMLWKATSPATFGSYELDMVGASDMANIELLPIPPSPFYFSSNEAALNVAMFNGYLGCAVAMINVTDPDPVARELEAFNLVYQNLCIAAGLIERHKDFEKSQSPYKPCDAISMGITTFLFHGVRRCFSAVWQTWSIAALRQIGREGLSNGRTLANTADIMCQLEASNRLVTAQQLLTTETNDYLGPMRSRLVPLIMPRGDEDQYLAFFLKNRDIADKYDQGIIQVVARATWKQSVTGVLNSLKLHVFDGTNDEQFHDPKMFLSWRKAVEKGWHGYLSREIQDGFLQDGFIKP